MIYVIDLIRMTIACQCFCVFYKHIFESCGCHIYLIRLENSSKWKKILRFKFALMPFLYLKRMHLFSTISCLHSDTKSIYRHAHLLHNWLICAASSVYLPVLEMQWFTNTHVWNVGDCRRKCTWHLKKKFFQDLNSIPHCCNFIVQVKKLL